MNKNYNNIPRYILLYYGYEVLYSIFWLVIPKIVDKDMILIYVLTTLVAVGWGGYMIYRLLVSHDKNVSALVIISNFVVLEVISRQIF